MHLQTNCTENVKNSCYYQVNSIVRRALDSRLLIERNKRVLLEGSVFEELRLLLSFGLTFAKITSFVLQDL